MRPIVIACILATVGCGPAFTEAVDGPLVTTDGAVGLETDAIDGGTSREASAVEVDGGAKADAMIDPPDADPPMVDAGVRDAARDVEHDAAPDVAEPLDTGTGAPRCDGPFGVTACGSWASEYCGAAGEAMCCRSDGVCGCKVTSTAACQ